jgi:anti-anti-sigma factor
MSKYDRTATRGRRGARGVGGLRHAALLGDSQSSTRLTIDRRRDGPRVVLTAAGEVDIGNADRLQRALDAARDGDAPEIWLDLTDMTFIDCRGLRALRDLRACLLERDRRLVLICPVGPVLRLLALTGCDSEFEIHPTTSPRRGR